MSWDDERIGRSQHELPAGFYEKLATIKWAARSIGVTPSTIHNWISRGYVNQWGERKWLMGVHINGVRYVLPAEVLVANSEVQDAARGGLRKQAM